MFFLSIIYGYVVKQRVEKFVNANNDDDENEAMLASPSSEQNPRDGRESLSHFSTCSIYVVHLIVARIIPLSVFAVRFFYPADIPENFSCPWSPVMQGTSNFNVTFNSGYNSTFIGCTNPNGANSKILVDVVATVDVAVVVVANLELCYIAWLAYNDRDFMSDQEFCTVYLLRKRKRIRKVMNRVRDRFSPDNQQIFKIQDDFGDVDISLRPLEDIYVNVVIQEEREHMNAYPKEIDDRRRIYQSHLEAPSTVTKLTSTADIFKPKKDDKSQTYPRTILLIGRAGIGKTLLTKKLLQQWKMKEDEFLREKIVLLLKFRTLNNKTVTLRELLGYAVGLSFDDDFEIVYKFILSNPTKTVLIFDGLDELDVDNKRLCTHTETVGSRDKKMPVFSIFEMLVDGRLLHGVTVLITSRPTAECVFRNLKVKRTVEILGFFEEQIKEYVFRFCENNNTAELIWNHIKGSAELLSLCFIPVNSYIVCLTLKESTGNDESRDIPKTITEMYKRAVKVLVYRHHPIYKLEPLPTDYLTTHFPEELKNDLSKLKEVAQSGIIEGKLIFERSTRDEFGDLANCGLFHKLSDKRRNYFCFLHLTLQEFLAASKVVDDMDKVDQFLATHIKDPKWHLVIQFVAGLVGDKIKQHEISQSNLTDIQKRYYIFFV